MRHALIFVGLLSGLVCHSVLASEPKSESQEEAGYTFTKNDLPYAVALFRAEKELGQLNQPQTAVSAAWYDSDKEGNTHYQYLIKRCGYTECLPWKNLSVVEDRRREIADAPPEYSASVTEPLSPPFAPKHALFIHALNALLKSSEAVTEVRESATTVFAVTVDSENNGRDRNYTFLLGNEGAWIGKQVTSVLYVTETVDKENNSVWRAKLLGGKN